MHISDGTVMKVPEGAKCDDCGHVHSQGFSWLTRTAFRKMYRNDSTFQKAVIEGTSNSRASARYSCSSWRSDSPLAC